MNEIVKLTANRTLGNTGLSVPIVIYGTSYLGNLYIELPYKDKLALISKWFECTETPVTIDTAGKYGAGLALEIIGKGLSELGVSSDDILISNKLGWFRIPLKEKEPTFEPGAWANLNYDAIQTFGYNEIIKCYEQGNKLLGREYRTKLVSVHDPDEYLLSAGDENTRKRRFNEILESYRALFDLKKRGEVEAVGIGSKDWWIIRELYSYVKFDWVMFANSFTIYSHPVALINFMDQLHNEGVGIINSAVFHGGFLTGGTKFDYRDVDKDSKEGKNMYRWRDSFYEICKKYEVVPGEACVHFGLSHPAIASLALNTSKPRKMEINVEILQKKISNEFWDALREKNIIDEDYVYI